MFGCAACLTIFLFTINLLGYVSLSYRIIFAPVIFAFGITALFGLFAVGIIATMDYIVTSERFKEWKDLHKQEKN